ncbi:MAG: hypothetical protein MUF78_05960 [Candidatus Edwardsbacteria bacterium]|jgi:hypothetical protein|nr:hypothetical protein [Candidatus Edwardsbacteria bacterium]
MAVSGNRHGKGVFMPAVLIGAGLAVMLCSCTSVRHALGIYDILTPEEAVLVNEVNEFRPGCCGGIDAAFVEINGEDPSPWILRRLQRRTTLPLRPASASVNVHESLASGQSLMIMDTARRTYGVLIKVSADSTFGDTTVVDASYLAGPRFGRWRTYKVTNKDHRWIIRQFGDEIISDLSPRRQHHSRV